MPAGESWRRHAACAGTNPALFYDPHPDAQYAAKLVCATCPVRLACADHAARNAEPYGVWGGHTEHERAAHDQRHGPGGGPRADVSDDELVVVFADADPDRPALAVLLDAHPVSTPTAYKYLQRARRLGLVEARGRNLYSTR